MEGLNISHVDFNIQDSILRVSFNNDSAHHVQVDVPHRVTGVVVSTRSSEGLSEVS